MHNLDLVLLLWENKNRLQILAVLSSKSKLKTMMKIKKEFKKDCYPKLD